MEMKTMATGSKEVGRTVEIKKETSTPMVPGDYHTFMGSESKQSDGGFPGRMSAIEAALGGKDSIKG